jgi:hypothetical protein
MLNDLQSTDSFKRALLQKGKSCSTMLVIPWDTKKRNFTMKISSFKKFKPKIQKKKIEEVLESLKSCTYYQVSSPDNNVLRAAMLIIFGILCGVYISMTIILILTKKPTSFFII